jgi:1-acyl-sn-glycerol-3-phosphate acyltransferase
MPAPVGQATWLTEWPPSLRGRGSAATSILGFESTPMSRHSKGRILKWLHGVGGVPWGADPDDYDPVAIEHTLGTLGELFGEEGWPRRYFPLAVDGLQRIPPAPVLVVSNHSGGTTIPDVWGFLVAWYRRFGSARPIHPLAHEMIVSTRLTGPYFARRGILRATRALALDALRRSHDVMVMPGGDAEVWRPWRKRYQVEFAGRTGYARIALEAGVPIVPVAHAGAHNTFMVLSDGRWLARLLRMKHIARSDVWPVHLSLPWGLGIGPLPHIPLPAHLRYRIGDPIVPPRLEEGRAPTEEQVRKLDEEVRATIQSMLDELRHAGTSPNPFKLLRTSAT